MGSFSSEKALAYSWPAMNSSKRSVSRGSSGLRLDRGDISHRIVYDEGGLDKGVLHKRVEHHGQYLARSSGLVLYLYAKALCLGTGLFSVRLIKSTPVFSLTASFMVTLLKGAVRSISLP